MPCCIRSISVLIMLHKTRGNSSLGPKISIGDAQQVYYRRYHRHRVSSSSHSQHSVTRGTQSAHRPTRQSTNGPGPASPAGSQASRNSNTHYRDSLLNTNVRQLPDTVIIGTSLVRGVSSNLHKRNIDNVSYCYPGAEIPTIRSRINSVLPRNSTPRQVFLQAGGNDLESHPADQVIKQYDKLIHQVKSRCSNATTILLGRIPPRRHPALTDKIK